MARTVKLFRNGRSQAVRLPSDCRFEGSEVDLAATAGPTMSFFQKGRSPGETFSY